MPSPRLLDCSRTSIAMLCPRPPIWLPEPFFGLSNAEFEAVMVTNLYSTIYNGNYFFVSLTAFEELIMQGIWSGDIAASMDSTHFTATSSSLWTVSFQPCGRFAQNTNHDEQWPHDSRVVLSIYPLLDCPWVSVVGKKLER